MIDPYGYNKQYTAQGYGTGPMAGPAIALPPGLFFGPGPINPGGLNPNPVQGDDPYAMFQGQNPGGDEQRLPPAVRKRTQGYKSASARKPGVGGQLFNDLRKPTALPQSQPNWQ